MGLSKQHWAQQVLLARCYDYDVAVAVLAVVAEFLQCRVDRDGISSAVSPPWQGEDFKEWVDTFWGRLAPRLPDLEMGREGRALR